jgi:ELWxxDGT repeat protein
VPDLAPIVPVYLAAAGDDLYVFHNAGNNQWQVWRTDGTADGTALLATISGSGGLQQATPMGEFDGLLYFRASGPEGVELWRTDGTEAGTVLVSDVRPGAEGSVPRNLTFGGDRLYFTADDGTHGVELWSVPLGNTPPATTVVGRSVFYNNSSFDGRNAAGNVADLAAVAPDKQALLPGQTGGFANVTSYARGINGLLLTLFNPASPPRLGADDLEFKVGTGGDPSSWAAGPAPAGISVIPVPGPNTVYAITWPDGAIRDTWLRVTVKANANTGLAEPDVFYFGNLVGETGDAAAPLRVNALDLVAVRRVLSSTTPIAGRLDFDRDGRVSALDLAALRAHLNRGLAPVSTGPSGGAAAATFGTVSIAAVEPLPVQRVWDEGGADLLG